MTILPNLVKGMHDRNAFQIYRRNYILSVIESIYANYGFEPLETPALENRLTLTGKYGDEGEQLMFNVLKSGNFLEGLDLANNMQDDKILKRFISDKGLRYDLTVPLMRYIAIHQDKICFPFRRYQVQPVWRADRPQKGRYREFIQCDADIVGSSSLLCEVEIIKLIYDVSTKLEIKNFQIKINHIGILSAIANPANTNNSAKEKAFCIIVDKLEKIGLTKVKSELQAANFTEQTIRLLILLQNFKGDNNQILNQLTKVIGHTDQGLKSIEELRSILEQVYMFGIPTGVCYLEPTFARGLSYYTGLITELTVPDISIGSLGGGGRYENLGQLFGTTGRTGVGFSFGIDRVYDLMEVQNLFASIPNHTTDVLLTNMENKIEKKLLLQLLNQLRTEGFKAELYPETVKIKKQLVYAHKKNIPFVIILGETESSMNQYTLKNMQTGEQNSHNWPQICAVLKKALAIKN